MLNDGICMLEPIPGTVYSIDATMLDALVGNAVTISAYIILFFKLYFSDFFCVRYVSPNNAVSA